MSFSAEYFISQLELEAHIEGGYFKELYKSCHTITCTGSDFKKERSISSTIYYLLKSGQVSKFHRLTSDELWFFHSGSPLLIHMIDSQGVLRTTKLGLAIAEGELPQVLVPANIIFGAEVAEENSFSLVSCMVSPGFDYRDFLLFTGEELRKQYPAHSATITKLNG